MVQERGNFRQKLPRLLLEGEFKEDAYVEIWKRNRSTSYQPI